jgi:hypothetical protein
MMPLAEIKPTCRNLILAQPLWADEAVLDDEGLSTKAEETALLTDGHVCVVLPLLSASLADQAGTVAIADVGVGILVSINPKLASKKMLELMQAVRTALLESYTAATPADKFRLAERPFVLQDDDPGLLSYLLLFVKRATL